MICFFSFLLFYNDRSTMADWQCYPIKQLFTALLRQRLSNCSPLGKIACQKIVTKTVKRGEIKRHSFFLSFAIFPYSASRFNGKVYLFINPHPPFLVFWAKAMMDENVGESIAKNKETGNEINKLINKALSLWQRHKTLFLYGNWPLWKATMADA